MDRRLHKFPQSAQALEQERIEGAALMRNEPRAIAAESGQIVTAAGIAR
jgi:hypothetical protein